ncbi:MAG: hypothetical protein AAF799_18540 [Myxococcota bacterium]
MSKPKKPGTDLAALKARLAKKTKSADAPAAEVPAPGQVAAPAAPAPEVPAPGQVAAPEVPAPGEVAAPAAAAPEVPPPGQVAAPDVPPPGEVAAPVPEVPPPGQVAAPDVPPPGQPVEAAVQAAAHAEQHYQAPAAPAPTQTDDNPFGAGGGMGGFDPDAGLIDGGPEIKPRGGKGIVIFAALIAAGIGGVGGWLGHTINSKQGQIDQGKAKGKVMVDQVGKISEARKTVSLGMEDLKKEVAQDPAAAADKVSGLMSKAFDKQPQISELFGWQLASVDPQGVKATFQLYEQVTDLQNDLGLMAKVLHGYGKVMKVGGPSLYGVTFGPKGAQLVAVSDSLCGAPPAEGDKPPAEGEAPKLKPCGAEAAKAIAYKVNDLSGEPKVMMRGMGPGQVVLLLAEGKVYEYAIGIEQGNNAANFYKMALGRVEESLAEMDKSEEKALTALKKYADDPNVDGSGGDG